jgi:hypothetical protein
LVDEMCFLQLVNPTSTCRGLEVKKWTNSRARRHGYKSDFKLFG